MKKYLILPCILCYAIFAGASTDITTSTVAGHWTLAGSPYLIFNDISVAGGSTLKIDPGVTVLFQGTFLLSISGILQAQGSVSLPINFSVQDTTGWSTDSISSAGGWHGVQFLSYSGSAIDNSIFQYCNISFVKFDSSCSFDLAALHTERMLTVRACNFFNNRTSKNAACNIISCSTFYSTGSFEMDSCTVHDNFSNASCIMLENGASSNSFFRENKIYNNTSCQYMLMCNNATITVENNEIYENNSIGTGIDGAIFYITLGNALVIGNSIHHNIAYGHGALSCSGAIVNIIKNIICNNQHTDGSCGVEGGGGIWLYDGTGNSFYNVQDNIIANNLSAYQGGGIYVYNTKAIIENNQIINNTAISGAAIQIRNYVDSSSVVIKNNIFFGNFASSAPNTNVDVYSLGNVEYDHNWTQYPHYVDIVVTNGTLSGDSTTNIIGADPGLTMPTLTADVTESALSANFSLLPTSSCIDKGDTTGLWGYPLDYAGNSRVFGSSIDIGAYEHGAGPLNVAPIITPAAEHSISVFPNPATASITINDANIITSVIFRNILGQTVYTHQCNSQPVQIDVSTLAPGVYFLKVNGTEVQKFEKK